MECWSTMKRVSVLLEDCRSMLGNRVHIKVVGDIPGPLEDAEMASASRKNKTEVHKVKSHHCPHCDKRFPQPSKLKEHMLTHNRKESYHCPDCDLNDCKQHQQMHNGEKPYSCLKCERCFSSAKCTQEKSFIVALIVERDSLQIVIYKSTIEYILARSLTPALTVEIALTH
ncbi:hypothetical protein UPYG_G00226280 [Umbra pygmaea]|uniref:C2H2-type domain-containing protein n=1 Tax=Umbra pygmaea TaxID=75934 RepID=A0ABD0WHL3_UMBPY